MTSVGVIPASVLREPSVNMVVVDKLPQEMNDMKIRDDKEMETVIDGNGNEIGHIIVTTIGGRDGQPKQGTISYMAERVVGQWSFGVVFQAKCLEIGETVAVKKFLQDKRYKNRELQTMRLLDHPNVVALKHCFFPTTDKKELYLNLVLEYVPETVHRVIRHYNKMNQQMSLVHVKLYAYQVQILRGEEPGTSSFRQISGRLTRSLIPLQRIWLQEVRSHQQMCLLEIQRIVRLLERIQAANMLMIVDEKVHMM